MPPQILTNSSPSSPKLISVIEDYSSPENSLSSSSISLPKENLDGFEELDPLTFAAMQRELQDEEIFSMDSFSKKKNEEISLSASSPHIMNPHFSRSLSSSSSSIENSEQILENVEKISEKNSEKTAENSKNSEKNSEKMAENNSRKSFVSSMFGSPTKTHRRSFSQNSTPLPSPLKVSPLKSSDNSKVLKIKSIDDLNTSKLNRSKDSIDWMVEKMEKETKKEEEEKRKLTTSLSFNASTGLESSPSVFSRLFGSKSNSPSVLRENSSNENLKKEEEKFLNKSSNLSSSSLTKLEEDESFKEAMREALEASIRDSMKKPVEKEQKGEEKRLKIYQLSHPFWQREDRIGQLMLLIFSAFVLGYFRLSVIGVFIVIYLIYLVDHGRQLNWAEQRRVFLQNNQKADSSENKQKEETTKWLNNISAVLFPHLSHNIATATKNTLKSLIENSLEQKKPAAVESISVSHISFGNTPALFSNISGTKPPWTDFSFDLDLSYRGPLNIVVDLLLGGKFVNVRLPISIQDFDLTGRLRLDLTFFSKPPYLHTYKFSFTKLPNLSYSVKPMRGTVNVLDFPFVEGWIFDSMSHLIKTTCVLPNQISVPFHLGFATAEGSAVKPIVVKAEDKVGNLSDSDSDTDFSADLHGIVILRINEARLNIRDRSFEKCLPQVIVTNGVETFTTSKCRGNIKEPHWNELIQLTVKKDISSTRVLDIFVRVSREVTSTLLGKMTIRVDDLIPDATADVWYNLVDDNRNDVGKIHIISKYLPPDNTT